MESGQEISNKDPFAPPLNNDDNEPNPVGNDIPLDINVTDYDYNSDINVDFLHNTDFDPLAIWEETLVAREAVVEAKENADLHREEKMLKLKLLNKTVARVKRSNKRATSEINKKLIQEALGPAGVILSEADRSVEYAAIEAKITTYKEQSYQKQIQIEEMVSEVESLKTDVANLKCEKATLEAALKVQEAIVASLHGGAVEESAQPRPSE